MVGIPFKKLDKKSEKKLLSARRKELTKQLQETSEIVDVFELALILLSQQTRSIVLGHINRPVLSWILKEKKIPSAVESLFRKAFLLIDNEPESIPENDVKMMKDCGLAKDITSLF